MSHKYTEPPTTQETKVFLSPRLRVKAAYLILCKHRPKLEGENRKRKRVKRNVNTTKKNLKGGRMRSTENRESLLGEDL